MLQVRRDLDLGEKPVDAKHGAEFGLQDLERDLTVVLEVAGEVHRRHAAFADFANDGVAAGEGRVELPHGIYGHCMGYGRYGPEAV